MKVKYDDLVYNVEQVTGDIFRLWGNGLEIKFTLEFRNGMYFKICSVTKRDGRTYKAQRYHYPYIMLIREASFIIWKEMGIYDYTNQKFVDYEIFKNNKNKLLTK